MRSRCRPCVCISPIVARHQLCKNPPIVARKRLGKNHFIVARQRLDKNPLSLLGNGSVETLPRQRIHTQL
jgi:hypothetical protein